MPLYAALSHYFGTHSFTYAWSVSAAYLSGPTALALELIFFYILVGLLLYLHRLFVLPQMTILPNATSEAAAGPAGAPIMATRSQMCERFAVYAALLLLNMACVVGANVGYVYATQAPTTKR